MNNLKRIGIAIMASFGCMSAHAVGPYDGIYFCDLTLLGNPTSTYITVNSSGTTGVFTIPYLVAGQTWQGYGIGTWYGSVLSGTTNSGGAFSAAAVGYGALDFIVDVNSYGTFYQATGTCSQVI